MTIEYIENKIVVPATLASTMDEVKCLGKTLVSTNGCFDVLHLGHIDYLFKAKDLGDILIVVLNSDASVSRLKGPERPRVPLEQRLRVVAALQGVDHVSWFEEPDPRVILADIRPDVHCKGGDYRDKGLIERDVVESYGGEISFIDFEIMQSSSSILKR